MMAFINLLQLGLIIPTTLSFSTPQSSPTQKKIALITGANKGVGKEIARRIGTEPDFTAVIACRDLELGRFAVEELQSGDNEYECDAILLPVPFDLTDSSSISDAAKYIEEKYGVLDVLVNNAAVCFNDPTLYGKVDHTPFQDQADITIKTNFYGTLECTQSFLPLLNKSASPRIINVASAAGRLTILRSQELVDKFTSDQLTTSELCKLMNQFVMDVEDGTHAEKGWPNTCYGMSKLGIIALTRILAREHPGMMINSVDPGYCKTDQNNNQGVVDPMDGAYTPYLLALMEVDDSGEEVEEEEGSEVISGLHFYEEQEMPWSYQQ
jgi:carbonyl reductase 1